MAFETIKQVTPSERPVDDHCQAALGGEHSVFAKALLETLGTNTEVLDGQSLFNAIKRPVVVNADQTPEYADVRKAGHDGGDFLFVKNVNDPSESVRFAPES